MGWPLRVTPPLLDTLEVLVRAGTDEILGLTVVELVLRTPATTYQQLQRLRAAHWVTSRWETEAEIAARGANPDTAPRRRYYRIAPNVRPLMVELLEERRPARSDLSTHMPIPATGSWTG